MQNLMAAAGVLLGALLITGCATQEPAASPAPRPTSTPVFASDEEALAAAEAAYAEYQAEVDHALSTYDLGRLPSVAEGAALESATKSVSQFKDAGRVLSGFSSIDSVSLARFGGALVGDKDEPLQLYGCLDVTETDVTDANGQSVVDEFRTVRVPMIVSLVWKDDLGKFLVSVADVWDGDDFCN